jgi:phosphoribosyl 1,2-cyclic phosphodiesterase
MRVTVCGVRGSTPAAGADFVRFGGNTSCVAIAHDGALPSLVLDSGTGIRAVTGLLGGEPFRGAIILGHLHWDHTQGLPFFRGADRPDSRVAVHVPEQGDTEEVLGRFMSPPSFPIRPGELRGDWSFCGLEPGEHEIEGFGVLALEIPHKGGRAFGYRVSDGSSAVTYMSDHCPTNLGPGPDGLGEHHAAAVRLVSGCDVLFHDAQYLDAELGARASFGHSSCGYAVGLAEATGVGRLLLYHHDPERTDDEVDAIVASYSDAAVAVEAAYEGMVIDLPRVAAA